MKSRIFYTVVFILMVVIGILLAIQNHRLRKELQYCSEMQKYYNNSNTDVNHLKGILHNYLSSDLERSDFEWKLVIIYSPEDCPPCIDEIDYWADFHEEKNRFGCWGLINHPHPELTSRFLESMGWSFPNRIITGNELGENFGLKKTPIKILLDKKNRIYFIEGPMPNWKEKGKLKELVLNFYKE